MNQSVGVIVQNNHLQKLAIQLAQIGSSSIKHSGMGLCPDLIQGFESRDPECYACMLLIEADQLLSTNQVSGTTEHVAGSIPAGLYWSRAHHSHENSRRLIQITDPDGRVSVLYPQPGSYTFSQSSFFSVNDLLGPADACAIPEVS